MKITIITKNKFEVEYNNKKDIIYYSSEWGSFCPHDGNFNDDEFEKVKEKLFFEIKK